MDRDAQPSARDLPRRRKLRQDVLQRVDRNGKPDTAPLRTDRSVDADHLTQQVEQRAAAVARVDRGIGLDEIVVRTSSDRPGLRAHDAHRHRVAEPKWIADGDDVFADAQCFARAERDVR